MNATKTHPIRTIRSAGVPLCAFETSDPAQTIQAIIKGLGDEAAKVPIMLWDVVQALVPVGGPTAKLTAQVIAALVPDGVDIEMATSALPECLKWIGRAALKTNDKGNSVVSDSVVFICNSHRYIAAEAVAQGIWNLRDSFKGIGATCVLLCPTITLPSELAQDVVVVSEPLPTADEIVTIIDSVVADAEQDPKSIQDKDKVSHALLGLSGFAAEQAVAMSITRKGINREDLWERKRRMVEQTPGLSVWRGKQSTFDNLGGLAPLKTYLKRVLTSPTNPVRCIGFIDEIEKLFSSASQGDTSNVSQDQLRVLLTEMQDNDINGMILIGPPGTGKSEIGKAAAAVADAEFIQMDTGAMTGSLVGESQRKIREAFKTFKAICQGKGMIIATCNKIASLPPELRRRFSLGTFYVDLPTKEERGVIWPIWMKRYGFDIETQMRPEDEGWTGAEIKACCDVAYRTGMNLIDASKFIVPVCKSAADQIAALREQANGRFISANHPGIYEYVRPEGAPAPKRKIKLTAEMDAPPQTNEE